MTTVTAHHRPGRQDQAVGEVWQVTVVDAECPSGSQLGTVVPDCTVTEAAGLVVSYPAAGFAAEVMTAVRVLACLQGTLIDLARHHRAARVDRPPC